MEIRSIIEHEVQNFQTVATMKIQQVSPKYYSLLCCIIKNKYLTLFMQHIEEE